MHPVRSLRTVLCKASRRLFWTDPWMGALLSRRESETPIFLLHIGTHEIIIVIRIKIRIIRRIILR